MVKLKKETESEEIEEIKEEISKSEDKEVFGEAKIIQVPTQFTTAVQLEDGSIVDDAQLLLKIYNDVQKILKELGAK